MLLVKVSWIKLRERQYIFYSSRNESNKALMEHDASSLYKFSLTCSDLTTLPVHGEPLHFLVIGFT